MSPTATGSQPLLYFIHDDFDALRMELSGRLSGAAANKAYEAAQTARSITRRQSLVIDISYVTAVDELGSVVLRAWREQGARVVASSLLPQAITDSIASAPATGRLPKRTIFDLLASWRRNAGNTARADAMTDSSAVAKTRNVENVRVPVRCAMERQMR